MTAYEKALREQIAFLEDELRRYQNERDRGALPGPDDPPIDWALRDPRFLQWRLLRQQLESKVRR